MLTYFYFIELYAVFKLTVLHKTIEKCFFTGGLKSKLYFEKN